MGMLLVCPPVNTRDRFTMMDNHFPLQMAVTPVLVLEARSYVLSDSVCPPVNTMDRFIVMDNHFPLQMAVTPVLVLGVRSDVLSDSVRPPVNTMDRFILMDNHFPLQMAVILVLVLLVQSLVQKEPASHNVLLMKMMQTFALQDFTVPQSHVVIIWVLVRLCLIFVYRYSIQFVVVMGELMVMHVRLLPLV
jgi:hypothetical protein